MQKLIFGLLLIGIISCTENKVSEFSLTGKTNGIENGTLLILENSETKEVLDSTMIENNSFVFNTKLSSSPTRAVFHTKDFSNYRFVWLENNEMTFDATNTNFRNAKITGSETEMLRFQLSQSLDSVGQPKRRKIEQEFVQNNPNSLVSANILSIYSTTWGKEKTSELFDLFSNEIKASVYGQKIQNYIKLNKSPDIGETFVDFEMNDMNGLSRKLSEFNNKLVLLEFWASWCGPCRQENPNLVKTYEKYNPKGFDIFAISLDESEENWKKAIKKDGLTWTHASDLKGDENKAGLIYGVSGIPDNFLIDKNGKIVARNLRGEKLDKKLAELIK